MHCLQGSVEGPQERTQIHVQSPYSPQQAHVPQPEQPPRPADTMAEKKKTTAGSSRSLRVCHEQEQELHVAPEQHNGSSPPRSTLRARMAPIDYTRWEHIQGDSSEEDQEEEEEDVFRNPPGSRSPRRDIVRGLFAVREPPKPNTEEQRYLLRAEQRELRRYLRNNPCPSKRLIQQWLLGMATTPITESSPIPSFTWVMESMGWKYEHLGWFHYRSLTTLWTTGTIRTADAFDAQRKTGIQLYRRGGRACMQFNYYVLHYTMCGQHFIRDPPIAAFGFCSHIEKVWDGIGSWQA